MKKGDYIVIENSGSFKIETATDKAVMIKVSSDQSQNDYTQDSRNSIWLPLSQIFVEYSKVESPFTDGSDVRTNHYASVRTWLLKKNGLI